MQFVKHIFIRGLGYVKLKTPKVVPYACGHECKNPKKKKNEKSKPKKKAAK